MNQRFLAIGECMVEMSPKGSSDYALSFAGDTFNTAWYLRQQVSADLEVAYLTAVGDDVLSKRLTDFIQASGIVPEVGVVRDRTLGLYMISLVDGERSFQYWRDTSAARCLAEYLDPLKGLAKGDMAYFSGITMAILTNEYRAILLHRLKQIRVAGVTIVFDTNLRPKLWEDVDEMRQWVMQAAAVAEIVLPSFGDEMEFFGDTDKQATLQRYQGTSDKQVIVKDGPNAVLFQGENGELEEYMPMLNPSPIDTTAAGDSFNAGFLAAYFKGLSPKEAVAAGCDLAHQVVSECGALVSNERL
ncbi:MAG: sugar kinase [Leucothrix sp.]